MPVVIEINETSTLPPLNQPYQNKSPSNQSMCFSKVHKFLKRAFVLSHKYIKYICKKARDILYYEHDKRQRLEKERLEKERLEKERLEKERLEKERLELERLEQLNLIKIKEYNLEQTHAELKKTIDALILEYADITDELHSLKLEYQYLQTLLGLEEKNDKLIEFKSEIVTEQQEKDEIKSFKNCKEICNDVNNILKCL